MKEALLYTPQKDNKVKCRLCNHTCLISPDKKGICGVKKNIDGKLYSLVYDKVISEAIDPIEKKPFLHYLPGSFALSIATLGCNFRCDNCQNWQISQGTKGKEQILGKNIPPKKIIKDALGNNCRSIAYTYTEPTIFFELALDCMKIAKKAGLKNVFVSNGFMSEECLEMAGEYLDAINIDLKFFDNQSYQKYCGGRLDPILQNLKKIKKMGIWLEVTTLSIPSLSDSEEMFTQMAEFISGELGNETPWHISRFSGGISYKLGKVKDTPLETLYKAYEIGKKAGLKYVYLGNIPGDKYENTYCPSCQELIIERVGYQINRYDKNSYCPKCNQKINLILK